jgi:NADH:ubiquinone oxidoreductase subunit D
MILNPFYIIDIIDIDSDIEFHDDWIDVEIGLLHRGTEKSMNQCNINSIIPYIDNNVIISDIMMYNYLWSYRIRYIIIIYYRRIIRYNTIKIYSIQYDIIIEDIIIVMFIIMNYIWYITNWIQL